MKRRPLIILAVGLVVVAGLVVWSLWPRNPILPPEWRPKGVVHPPAGEPEKLVIEEERGAVHLINPDGTGLQLVATYPPKHNLITAKLSPDRKRLAYAVEPTWDKPEVFIRVKDVDRDAVTELAKVQHVEHLFWSPDGKTLFGSGMDRTARDQEGSRWWECYTNWAINADTGEMTPLRLPSNYRAWGFAPNGKLICVREFDNRGPDGYPLGKGDDYETVQTGLDDFRPEVVIPHEQKLKPLALLPDGKTWVVRGEGVQFFTFITGKAEPKPWPWKCRWAHRAVVSPDGSRVVVLFSPFSGDDGGPDRSRYGLRTLTPDGSDEKLVWKPEASISTFDWR